MGNDNAKAALKRLLERAESTDREEGMTYADPLSIEVNGRYVDVLFTTGGPHIEVQLDYGYEGGGEFWYEDEPIGGRLDYANWGERESVYLDAREACLIHEGILRDPDELTPGDDEEDEFEDEFEEPAQSGE